MPDAMEFEKIGTTYGLAAGSGSHDQGDNRRVNPEQVYVFRSKGARERPVRVEAWVGYGIPAVLNLTQDQASTLGELLAQVATADPKRIWSLTPEEQVLIREGLSWLAAHTPHMGTADDSLKLKAVHRLQDKMERT